VDQHWVNVNREVVDFKRPSTVSNEDEIIERNGHDYATHGDDF
jgi:hypothetical protein